MASMHSQNAISLVNLKKRFRVSHYPAATLKAALTNFWKRRYQDLWALNGISIDIPRGQTIAIIGKNGSGKSTMLGLIARVYLPTCGQVRVEGKIAALLELGAGFHPDLTGDQNVLLNGVILGMRESEVKERLEDIIEFSELHEFRDAPLRSYSAGMVLRLGFSVAIHTDPNILLIDEVLAVGDEAFQKKCIEKIRKFQSDGGTIVFVSHDLESVEKVADRAIWIHKGELKLDGEPGRVIENYVRETAS